MCFLQAFLSFFQNHLSWCEKQVSSAKANSRCILGRKGEKYVVCLEFGSSLVLFMAAKGCAYSGGFVPFQPTFL